jgi:hypothetical protein
VTATAQTISIVRADIVIALLCIGLAAAAQHLWPNPYPSPGPEVRVVGVDAPSVRAGMVDVSPGLRGAGAGAPDLRGGIEA